MTLERRYLLDRAVQTNDAATVRTDLDDDGFLSAILLRIEITNGATAGEELVFDAIDRVEIVDGSEVLFSLEGRELYKWNWVWAKRRPAHFRRETLSAVQELALLIPFGRFIGDPKLNLDLSQLKAPQLTVEYSPTISGTTFATGTFTITAIQFKWPGGQAPIGRMGYIRTRQIRAFTSLASGETEIELSRLHPYLGALVYAREAAIADGVDITRVELREERGRITPYNQRWLDGQMENQILLDLDAVEHGIALQTDNANIDTLLSRILEAQIHLVEDTGGADANHPLARVASITANSDRMVTSVVEVDEAGTQADSAVATARYTLHWSAKGIGIGNALFVPMTLPGDVDNPYPAPEKSHVALVLTNGGAGADVRVSTQELVAA